LDHSEEVGRELVVAGGDPAEVLQLGEKALDQIALAIKPLAPISTSLVDGKERIDRHCLLSGA
jgi:hypothetical protein